MGAGAHQNTEKYSMSIKKKKEKKNEWECSPKIGRHNIFAHVLAMATFHYEKEERKEHRILSTRIGISIKSDEWFYDFTLLHAEN